ncbi:MAG: hypothetical protein ACI9LE_001965 [Paraglaciecola sp.]|jgi:hypothetical protein
MIDSIGSKSFSPPPPRSSNNLNLTDVVDYPETLFDEKDKTETGKSNITARFAERTSLTQGESLINITP